MTTQITVRLPDALVADMDEQVQAGSAKSRAAVVRLALEKAARRRRAERDAEVYAATDPDPEIEAWNTRADESRDWGHLD